MSTPEDDRPEDFDTPDVKHRTLLQETVEKLGPRPAVILTYLEEVGARLRKI